MKVAFGCKGILSLAGGVQQKRPAAGESSPHQSTVTEITGGTVEQQQLLHTTIDGLQPNAIAKIEVIPAVDGVTLQITAADNSAETLWEESLVAAAFRDRSKAAGNDLRVSLETSDSNGAVIPPGPGTAVPPATSGESQAARQRFEDAAGKTTASLDELTVYQPDGVAVAAVLRTDDPANFLLHQMPTFLSAIGDRWNDYDGVYIRLVDSSGVTVWETSTVARTSSGSVGARADLAGCSPIADWGPTPTACPVD